PPAESWSCAASLAPAHPFRGASYHAAQTPASASRGMLGAHIVWRSCHTIVISLLWYDARIFGVGSTVTRDVGAGAAKSRGSRTQYPKVAGPEVPKTWPSQIPRC